MLCCGYTLNDFPISIRLTSLALWQSNDCPSASKATLMNMDKYFMWIHYERLHNHNKANHNKTVCIFLGIYCMSKLHTRFVLCYVLLWFVSSQFTNTLQGHFTLAMRLSVTVAINYAIATVPVTINLSSVIHHQIGPNCYVAVNTSCNRIEALKSDVTMIISICSYTGTGRIATEACAKF